MTFIVWLTALAALLTAMAMLNDTYLDRAHRAEFGGTLLRAWYALRIGGVAAVDRAELSAAVRFLVRALVLIVVVASAGVCVVLPGTVQRGLSAYVVALLVALTVFMATQVPCPWWRYIAKGLRSHAPEGTRAH